MPPNSLIKIRLRDSFFPDVIRMNYIEIDKCIEELYDEELAAVRRAVTKRRNEFTAGRAMARAALARLGYSARPIPVGENREPLWPDGAVGSISHDGNLCIAVAALETNIALLGIDLTMRAPLEAEVVKMICTAEEAAAAQRSVERLEIDPYKLIFSIKESVYKCLFPVVREVFDFHCVSVTLDAAREVATVSLLDRELFSDQMCALRIEAKYCSFDDFIFSAVWIARRDWEGIR